ncbi:hypothetical protein [Nocardioides psychrotolerans]|uniref:Uncharacterized protein n=1 Tax=Nocardioides psychrotolerans TaxID=1005945 RepID=A0A1I3DRD1_9ACTN|nr:hypothetical protein [Nocardioides psychrotolerans]SFH89276.1 hypothetical protein SAMN05216561_10349 [Nocardioides psychrotolerans]
MTLPRAWTWLIVGAAVLAACGSAVGLLAISSIYGDETDVFADTAVAQDVVNLALVAPAMAAFAVAAARGSWRSYLCLLGFLAFTVYNYAIYAFSLQFGPLFLVWVGVLGLAIFALVGSLSSLDADQVRARFASRAMPRTAAFLVSVALLFGVLWMSEIVPDLVAGRPSSSASDWRVPTNPVHVLDLAFFLPALVVSGVLLLRRHPLGYVTVVGQLVWIALTCLPILVVPFVSSARGHEAVWAVEAPIGILCASTLVVLGLLLRRVGAHGETEPSQLG